MVDNEDDFIIGEDMDNDIIEDEDSIDNNYQINEILENDIFIFVLKIKDEEYLEIVSKVQDIKENKIILRDENTDKIYSILYENHNLILKTEDYEIIDIEKVQKIDLDDFDKENNVIKLTEVIYPTTEIDEILLTEKEKKYSPFIIIEELVSKMIDIMDIGDNNYKINNLRNIINDIYNLSLKDTSDKELYELNDRLLPNWLIPITSCEKQKCEENITEEFNLAFNENNTYQESMNLQNDLFDRFKINKDSNAFQTNEYSGLFLNEMTEINKIKQMRTRMKQLVPYIKNDKYDTNFQEISSNENIFIHGILEEPQNNLLYSYNIDSNNINFTIYEKSIFEKIIKKSLLNSTDKISENNLSHFIDSTTLSIKLEKDVYIIHRFNDIINETNFKELIKNNINKKEDILKYVLENNEIRFYNFKDLQKLLTKYNIDHSCLNKKCKEIIQNKLQENIKRYLSIYFKKYSKKKIKYVKKAKSKLTISEKSKLAFSYIIKIANIPLRNTYLTKYISTFTRSPKMDENQNYLYDYNTNKRSLCKHYLYLCKCEDQDIFKSMISIFGGEPNDGNIYCKNCNEYLINEEFSIYEGMDDNDKPLQFREQIQEDTNLNDENIEEYLTKKLNWVRIVKNITGSLGFQFEDKDIYEILQINEIINNDILANKRYEMMNVSDSENHPYISEIMKNKKEKTELQKKILDFQRMLINTNQLFVISSLILIYSQTSIPSYNSNKGINSKLLIKCDNITRSDINTEYIKIILEILNKYSNKYSDTPLWRSFNMCMKHNETYDTLITPIDQFKNTIIYLISPQFNKINQKVNEYFKYLKYTSKNYTKEEWSSYKPLKNNKIIHSINQFIKDEKDKYQVYYLKDFKGYLIENVSLLSTFEDTEVKPIYMQLKLKTYEILTNQSFLKLFRYIISCYGIQKESTIINNHISRFIETTDKKDEVIKIFTQNGWDNKEKRMKELSFYKLRNNVVPSLLKLYMDESVNLNPCFNHPEICNTFIHNSIQNYDALLLNTFPKRFYSYNPIKLYPTYEELNEDKEHNRCKFLFSLYKYNFNGEISKNMFNDSIIYFKIMKYLWDKDIPEYEDSQKILNFDNIESSDKNLKKIIETIHKSHVLKYNLHFLPFEYDYFKIDTLKEINNRYIVFYEEYSYKILSRYIEQDVENPLVNIQNIVKSYMDSSMDDYSSYKGDIKYNISQIIKQNTDIMMEISTFIVESRFLSTEKKKRILNLFKTNEEIANSKISSDILFNLFENIFTLDNDMILLYMKDIRFTLTQIVNNHNRNYNYPKEWGIDDENTDSFEKKKLLFHHQYFVKSKDNSNGFNYYKEETYYEIMNNLLNNLLPYFNNVNLLTGINDCLLNKNDMSDIFNNIFLSMLKIIITIIKGLNQEENVIIEESNPLFYSLQNMDYEKVELSIQLYSELLIDLCTNMFYEHFDPQWIYENNDSTLFQKRIARQKEREKQNRIKKLDESTSEERYITIRKQAMGQSNWYKEHAQEAAELVNSEEYSDLTSEELKQRLSEIYDKYLDEVENTEENVENHDALLPNLTVNSVNDGEFDGEAAYSMDDFDEDKENTEDTMYGLFDEEQEIE